MLICFSYSDLNEKMEGFPEKRFFWQEKVHPYLLKKIHRYLLKIVHSNLLKTIH
jgi:hypothetical protein